MSQEGNSSTMNNSNSGDTDNNAIVGWRDANTSVGAMDLFGSSATAEGGEIILGDVVSGQANSSKFGLFKTLLFVAGSVVGFYIWKKVK